MTINREDVIRIAKESIKKLGWAWKEPIRITESSEFFALTTNVGGVENVMVYISKTTGRPSSPWQWSAPVGKRKNDTKQMSVDDLLHVAKTACEQKGLTWKEPIYVRESEGYYEVITHANFTGGNILINVNKATGRPGLPRVWPR